MTTPTPAAAAVPQAVQVNTISERINGNPALVPKISKLLRHGFMGNIEQVSSLPPSPLCWSWQQLWIVF